MFKEKIKRRIRRITAFAAALLLAANFSLPAGTEIMGVSFGNAIVASAAVYFEVSGFSCVLDDGTLFIYGSGAMPDWNDMSEVPWYNNSSEIQSVQIGDGVTSIGDNAFNGCSSLQSITIPNSVTSIGVGVFANCTNLTSITILDGVTSIGDDAFNGCSSLQSITIPNSVTSIGDYAFNGCSSLQSITIPNSVTSIKEATFKDCEKLESVTFGENSQLTSIDRLAFGYCKSLKSITIPADVTSIKEATFKDCEKLESVTFGENSQLTSIDRLAFGYCKSLKSITIPADVTSIGQGAFSTCTNLTSIFLPEGANVESDAIPDTAAQVRYTVDGDNATVTDIAMGSQTSVSIPETIDGKTVASINTGALSSCTGLTSIFLPDGLDVSSADIPAAAAQIRYTVVDDGIILITEVNLNGQTSVNFPDNIGGKTVTAVFIEDGTAGVDVPPSAAQIKYTVSEDEKVTITEIALGTGQTSVDISETIGGKTVAAVAEDYRQYVGKHTHVPGEGTVSDVSYTEDGVSISFNCNICGECTCTYAFDEVTEDIVDMLKAQDIQLVIDFVNYSTATDGSDTLILTDAQIKAIEYVLEYDFSKSA